MLHCLGENNLLDLPAISAFRVLFIKDLSKPMTYPNDTAVNHA